MKITVMGCGSSLGTPAPGGFWGRCDPKEPKNNRTVSVHSSAIIMALDKVYGQTRLVSELK